MTGLWGLSGLAAAGLVTAAVVVGLRHRYAVVLVDGDSMLPVLRHGDRVLMRRIRPTRIRTGQVVVLGDERARGQRLIVKRVAALPGQPVPAEVRVGTAASGQEAPGQTVPAGQVVLLGDNAPVSVDSREHGFYPLRSVRGVALRQLAPPRGGDATGEP